MYVKKVRPIDGYLALARLLPFTEELPPLESASPAVVRRVNELWIDAAANQPELRLPVVGGSPDYRYEFFCRIREILAVFIEVINDPEVNRPKGENAVLDARILDLELPPQPLSVGLTGRGFYRAATDLEVFVNCLEQADVWQLKACPICDAPFLPHRTDQKACGPRCNNTLRSRRRPERVAKNPRGVRRAKRNIG